MAIRLYSEFLSDQGTQYKIELHDSSWLGGAYEFECDADGFTLNYSGETDDTISPIVSSEVEIGVAIRTGQVGNYFDALKTYQENRFRVVILKANSVPPPSQVYRERVIADGGTIEAMDCVQDAIEELGGNDYSLFWAGWVMQDLVTLEDSSEPYFMRLKAVDGFGRLANIDYTEDNDIDQTGLVLTKVVDAIQNSLLLIGVDDLFPSSKPYLETSVDWWETNYQTYSTSVDPLAEHAFDIRLFQNTDDDGNIVYSSALDILKNIATLYGARVYINDGKYIFEQYGNRAQTTRYVSRYYKDGTLVARVSYSDDVTLDQTSGNARLAGNSWSFLPALQSVSIKYVQRFLNIFNAFASYRFNGAGLSTAYYTIGFLAGGSGIKLAYSTGALNFAINASQSVYPLIPIFKWRIRIKDASTGTFYYCNREYNGVTSATAMYGVPTWSTTAGYYYFDLPAFFHISTTSTISQLVQIITPDLPVSGELYVELSFDRVVRSNDGASHSYNSIGFGSLWVFAIDDNNSQGSPGITYTAQNNSADIDSNLSLDLGEIYIADGPKQTGHLSVYNGSTWEGSSAWRKGSSGSSMPILKLLTLESMAINAEPVYQYNGKIFHDNTFQQRLVFDSGAYLMTSGKYNANFDEWDGTWYKIQSVRTNVTTIEPIDDKVDRQPASGGSSGGTSPNDIIGGRIGGMVIVEDTKSIGPFQEVTTGGKVNGTLEATGNTTLDQKLLVDGGAVLGISGVGTAYQARVEADGGTVEALSCVTTAAYNLSVLGGNNVNILQDTIVAEQLEVQKATSLKSTLAVDGASALSSTLAVSGATTLSSTLGVTGAATMSSTLGVTGNATFVSDADFEGSHTALIQDVTHNDGTEYTVETTDFIIFNKWEGANGQAYVNLPRVADSEGRMIRFKSDDTISANTYVTLRPDAVDTSATIDGETSVDFNRSYDGIMVLCHSNQWYIVQRKSK
jgi:hypothetical protein